MKSKNSKSVPFKYGLAAVLCTTMLAGAPAPVHSAAAELKSGNERINFSGKLRMLSQRMAAAGCNLNAGVNPDGSAKILTAAKVEFGKILGGLEGGSGDLKIDGGETDGAILGSIANVKATFAPIQAAAVSLTKNPADAASIDTIKGQNIDLLNAAKDLVKSVVGVYAERGGDAALGATIDVAGRQRMLTQKMSKEACQIWSGDAAAASDLQGTMQLFEASLNDLIAGENGMVQPPNRDIADGLDGILQHWTADKPLLEKALRGEDLSIEDRAALAKDLDKTLREMNRVVGLYVISKKKKGIVSDVGATERINFSGKLRMLSQRVAAAACNYNAGVKEDESLAILLSAKSEFDKITHGLEFGDADLSMSGEETRRKTLAALSSLNEEWAAMGSAIDGLVQSSNSDASLAHIKSQNMEVLSRAKLLVSELSGQYSDPTAMLQADAMLVDISGRQRMLTQKMSKESCMVWSGDAAAAEALSGTMQMFEVSLMALRDGMTEAGIKAAPTTAIFDGLDAIWTDWSAIKPHLEAAAAGQSADPATREQVFADLNVLLKDMNTVVGLYTVYGKTGL